MPQNLLAIHGVKGLICAVGEGGKILHWSGDGMEPVAVQAGGYLVNVETGACSCPDSASRCKHLIAVELVRGGLVKPDVPSKTPPPRGDLTKDEQGHVRAALRYQRIRAGGWAALAKALRYTPKGLQNALHGGVITASVAVRLARFAGVPVDDVLQGRWPPEGACPHCGRA